jgi:hypothetical protein
MRDLETMEIAIETAETGHLVFGTLHTNTAPSTVDRIIDKFPAARQNQIRAMLADSLRGVVAQTLCKRKSGGRVAALEILLVTPAVASNIREGKTHYIDSAMQTGRNLGMQRMDDTLLKLVTDGLISAEEAYLKALDKEAFEKRLREAGVAREEVQVEAAPTEAELRAARDVERVREYKLLLDREPIRLEALNNLAWILATNPNPQIRNGAEAMRLAERAQSLAKGEEVISVLDTLSAAYAEVGDFTRAEATARRGMEMAQAAGRTQAARLIEKQLRFYEQRRPMRDE